ncbi:hypothetical protein SAMN05216464_1396 [Mucilaginibacter pineti]|uniref:Uncharacterized protein n=1 Tax=Mucilaginibacter pineti TaxID=1391627 RepID=A0A1G7P9R3_9SPHI|nr:hypothetical protein SAMN05216464_1396 [Mucilaginibacter pineti]
MPLWAHMEMLMFGILVCYHYILVVFEIKFLGQLFYYVDLILQT